MSDPDLTFETTELRQRVLSRWENEGGATTQAASETSGEVPDLTNAELVHLRMRVIALENLMIAVLAEGSDLQRQLALDMGGYIAPRVGATQHPLTVQASHHMTDLVHRADHFRTATVPTQPYKSTPVFDEVTLPAGLRKEHRTKEGIWGVIQVLEGRLRYRVLEPGSEAILDPEHPGLIHPDQPHSVEPLGPMRMRVDFYTSPPDILPT
jgi:tellurite resistance-related uncharacterized protein